MGVVCYSSSLINQTLKGKYKMTTDDAMIAFLKDEAQAEQEDEKIWNQQEEQNRVILDLLKDDEEARKKWNWLVDAYGWAVRENSILQRVINLAFCDFVEHLVALKDDEDITNTDKEQLEAAKAIDPRLLNNAEQRKETRV
jgi:hypothetical protein